MDSDDILDLKNEIQGTKGSSECSKVNLGQRKEWLKSDVSFLRDHIKTLRAMSIAYLLDFRRDGEKTESLDEIQSGFEYLSKVINELCWLAEAVGYLEEEKKQKQLK